MTTSLGTKMGRVRKEVTKKSCAHNLVAEKDELISELAQAVANHFNNIMMAVTGYAELELKKVSAKDKRALDQMLANANRATLLIQTLLDFSRGSTSSPRPIELNALINDLSELLRGLLGERVELSLRLDANPSTIYEDRIDVQRSLFALLIVARNEMAGAGQLSLATSLVELNREFIQGDRFEPGEYVALSIENQSAVVKHSSSSDASLSKNEKPSLSLEGVEAIVGACRSFLRVSGESGVKSNFKLYFPLSKKGADADSGPTLPRYPAMARTILVVEDDDAVRLPAAEFLKMEGFKVLQARTGDEALSLVQQSRSSPDILVADLFMPKMSGHEVAAKLLEQYPDLKVIYMSGDPARTVAPGSGKASQNATLRKPFRLNVLRDRIHDLLGE
jgi:CheY-like chemotaxis protein